METNPSSCTKQSPSLLFSFSLALSLSLFLSEYESSHTIFHFTQDSGRLVYHFLTQYQLQQKFISEHPKGIRAYLTHSLVLRVSTALSPSACQNQVSHRWTNLGQKLNFKRSVSIRTPLMSSQETSLNGSHLHSQTAQFFSFEAHCQDFCVSYIIGYSVII